jgi:hypothetical protein
MGYASSLGLDVLIYVSRAARGAVRAKKTNCLAPRAARCAQIYDFFTPRHLKAAISGSHLDFLRHDSDAQRSKRKRPLATNCHQRPGPTTLDDTVS